MFEYLTTYELNKRDLALQKVCSAGVSDEFEAFLEYSNNFYASCANAVMQKGFKFPGKDSTDLGYFFVEGIGGVEQLSNETILYYFHYNKLGHDTRLNYYPVGEMPETAGEYWCGDENATDHEIGKAVLEKLGIIGISNIEYYFDYFKFGKDYESLGTFVYINDKIIDCSEYNEILGDVFEKEIETELNKTERIKL